MKEDGQRRIKVVHWRWGVSGWVHTDIWSGLEMWPWQTGPGSLWGLTSLVIYFHLHPVRLSMLWWSSKQKMKRVFLFVNWARGLAMPAASGRGLKETVQQNAQPERWAELWNHQLAEGREKKKKKNCSNNTTTEKENQLDHTVIRCYFSHIIFLRWWQTLVNQWRPRQKEKQSRNCWLLMRPITVQFHYVVSNVPRIPAWVRTVWPVTVPGAVLSEGAGRVLLIQ